MHLIIKAQQPQGKFMIQTMSTAQIDGRNLTPTDRRVLVFKAFDQLAVNKTMELVNDQDPQMLQSQFELEKAKQFSWEYLQSGPDVWRVAITKVKAPHGQGSCCGACGG